MGKAKGLTEVVRLLNTHLDTLPNKVFNCVFNGSDLGKAYSANAVLERLGYREKYEQTKGLQVRLKPQLEGSIENSDSGSKNNFADILFRLDFKENQIPYHFKKDTRKKKRIRISL